MLSVPKKLKLMLIYHSENPRALKKYAKTRLPVHWKSDGKAWVATALFKEWIDSCFVPEEKGYCKENIRLPVLFLVDNALGPLSNVNLYPNVRVIFLLPGTMLVLQPMDHSYMKSLQQVYYSNRHQRRNWARTCMC
jgi:hypothetical protein